MIAFLLIIALLNVPALFAPSAPVEPPPEPPPIVETIQATDAAKALPMSAKDKAEAAGGLAIIAACGYAGVRLARIGERRRRRNVITTDNAQFAALMRRLNDMAQIMEGVTDNE